MRPTSDGPSVGQETYEALRRDILFGRRAAGARLRLEGLRAEYGASISTLREVLNRLVSEGFVVAEDQRGFIVAPMSDADLREVAELRILLETHALAQSFEAGDTEWEGTVVAAHHKLRRMEEKVEAGDLSVLEAWKQYDWAFHQALISACGSRMLLDLHGSVSDKYLRYQMTRLSYRGRLALEEHRALLEAALDRDIATAQKVLRTHIQGGVDAVLAPVDSGHNNR